MDLCHITITSERDSRLPIFDGERSYLDALHRLGRVCDGKLALFALVAEHLHLVVCLDRPAAGRLAQAVQLTLRRIARTPLAPSYPKPVESRSHMRWLLRYLLEQPIRHKMPGHPALWVGSCLADLVGARVIAGLKLRLLEALPDFRLETALGVVGLSALDLPRLEVQELRDEGAGRLVSATAAALGVATPLRRKTPAEVHARRAIAWLGRKAGIARAEVAAALGVTQETVYLLERRPVLPETLAAVTRRMSLERLVHRAMASRLALIGSLIPPHQRAPSEQRRYPTADEEATSVLDGPPGELETLTGWRHAGERGSRR